MKEEEIIEGNKLIAEFMGYTLDGVFYPIGLLNPITGNDKRHHIEQLCFHIDWNWAMAAVETIERLPQGFECEIGKNLYWPGETQLYTCSIHTAGNSVRIEIENHLKIKAVWLALIDFIKQLE